MSEWIPKATYLPAARPAGPAWGGQDFSTTGKGGWGGKADWKGKSEWNHQGGWNQSKGWGGDQWSKGQQWNKGWGKFGKGGNSWGPKGWSDGGGPPLCHWDTPPPQQIISPGKGWAYAQAPPVQMVSHQPPPIQMVSHQAPSQSSVLVYDQSVGAYYEASVPVEPEPVEKKRCRAPSGRSLSSPPRTTPTSTPDEKRVRSELESLREFQRRVNAAEEEKAKQDSYAKLRAEVTADVRKELFASMPSGSDGSQSAAPADKRAPTQPSTAKGGRRVSVDDYPDFGSGDIIDSLAAHSVTATKCDELTPAMVASIQLAVSSATAHLQQPTPADSRSAASVSSADASFHGLARHDSPGVDAGAPRKPVRAPKKSAAAKAQENHVPPEGRNVPHVYPDLTREWVSPHGVRDLPGLTCGYGDAASEAPTQINGVAAVDPLPGFGGTPGYVSSDWEALKNAKKVGEEAAIALTQPYPEPYPEHVDRPDPRCGSDATRAMKMSAMQQTILCEQFPEVVRADVSTWGHFCNAIDCLPKTAKGQIIRRHKWKGLFGAKNATENIAAGAAKMVFK